MPCYDPRDEDTSSDLREATKKVDKLEGMLCAITHQLISEGILDKIITQAQREGKILIYPWVINHFDTDRTRLSSDITSRYSVDELRVIKDLLK